MKDHLDNVINKSWNYAGRCVTHKDEVMNAALGLGGEAGEVLDVLKKAYFHSPRDLGDIQEDLKKELGDVIFYWLKMLDLWNLSIEEVLKANKEKLESRHPELGKVAERFAAGYTK